MKKLLALATIGASLTPIAPALAADGNTNPSGSSPENFNVVASCESRVSMTENRLAEMETRHNENSKKMDAAIERLQEFINKAEEKNVDTASLQADLELLETYSADIEADYAAVHDHLVAMTQVDCSVMMNEDWKTEMDEAKALFEELKDNVANVRALKDTIKQHIESLLSDLRENTEIVPATDGSNS